MLYGKKKKKTLETLVECIHKPTNPQKVVDEALGKEQPRVKNNPAVRMMV